MKQQDIAVIIVVAFFAGIISYFASGMIFTPDSAKNQEVEKVDAISSDFKDPSKKYFNGEAINPVLPIEIGDSQNNNPLSSDQ